MKSVMRESRKGDRTGAAAVTAGRWNRLVRHASGIVVFSADYSLDASVSVTHTLSSPRLTSRSKQA